MLENLEDGEGTSRALVFGVLTEMIKQESLLAGFTGFTELVILKVLQAHKDEEKDVSFIIVHVHKTLTNHQNVPINDLKTTKAPNIQPPDLFRVFRQVVRAAESCAATMASSLPAELVVRVLNPIIKTGDFPVNQAAIKMLTKLVEKQSGAVVEHHLAEIMPGLLKVNLELAIKCCFLEV